MTEAHRGDLSYGHLGAAIYVSETRKWHFNRIPDQGRSLQLLGDSHQALPPTKRSPALPKVQSAKYRDKQIGQVIHTNPVLAPAAFLLPSLAQISEALNETVSSYDPLIGDLISFGKAVNLDNHYSGARAVDIAAVAGGPAGEAVRLIRLGRQQLQWERNTKTFLSIKKLGGGEQCVWMSNSSPVQQMCFSNGVDGPGSWLAVRSTVLVTILRPVMRRLPVPTHSIRSRSGHSFSRLDPNPFVQLSIKRTGGESFADVSFNPWNDHQLATVDLNGHWSIWNIKGQYQRRSTWTLEAGPAGHLENQGPGLEIVTEDGWGAVLWAANLNTLVVVRRSVIAVYDVENGPVRLSTCNLNFLTQSDIILDIKRSLKSPCNVYVLTSTKIVWLRLDVDTEDGRNESQPIAIVLLSWWHYRSYEDISLHMLLEEDNREDIMILLYSRLIPLTTGFVFNASTNQVPQSISDPFAVSLDHAKSVKGTLSSSIQTSGFQHRISTLALMLVDPTLSPNAHSQGRGHAAIENVSALYQIFTLRNDLSVIENLFVDLPVKETMPRGLLTTVRRRHAPKSSTRVKNDDFIIVDGVHSEDEGYPFFLDNPSSDVRERQSRFGKCERHPRTINMQWLASVIESRDPFSDEPSLDHKQSNVTKSFDYFLAIWRQRSQELYASQQAGIMTLFEISPLPPSLDDLDASSQSLQQFMEEISKEAGDYRDELGSTSEMHRQPCILSILSPSDLMTFQGCNTTSGDLLLLPIYDGFIQNWITPLTCEVPGRVRVKLGKNLKTVALHLYLASHRLSRLQLDRPTVERYNIEETSRDQLVLPVRRKSSINSMNKSRQKTTPFTQNDDSVPAEQLPRSALPLNSFSASLPTPSPTPSAHSLSSNQLAENAPHMRLTALAASIDRPALSDSAMRSLSHWTIKMNPAEYDWEESRRAIELRSDMETVEDEYKRKQEEREEKRKKRRRENTLSGSSQLAPPLVESSQHDTAIALPDSSQMSQPSLWLSSQPSLPHEPGTPHVRRGLANKAMVKKRIKTPGFH